MIFSELRNIDSELVQTALLRHCQVCKAKAGVPCVTLTDGTPIFEKWGNWTHLMRADGLPYTTPRKTA